MQRLTVGRMVSSGAVGSMAWRRTDSDERGDEVAIINVDQVGAASVADPQPVLARFVARQPVCWSDELGPWRAAAVGGLGSTPTLTNVEPPAHTRTRRIAQIASEPRREAAVQVPTAALPRLRLDDQPLQLPAIIADRGPQALHVSSDGVKRPAPAPAGA
jgi:hypothetical protein